MISPSYEREFKVQTFKHNQTEIITIFTPFTLKDCDDMELVRELEFITVDNGINWRAVG